MKKMIVSLIVMTTVIGMLAGCGNGEDKGTVFFLNRDEETDDTWQALAEEYTRQTNIEVKVVTADEDNYALTLAAELDKSAEPTLFHIGEQADLERFEDYCYDLSHTSFARELTTNNYNLYGDNGELYAVGYCYEAFGLITNKTLLQQAGYDVADIRSFADLKQVAEDITARSDALGFAAFTSAGLEDSSAFRFTEQLANVPLYYEFRDKGITGRALSLTGSYLENYKKIWDLYMHNATCAPEELSGKTLEDAREEFGNRQAVFYQNGTWEYRTLVDKYNMKPEELTMLPIYCDVSGEENAGLCLGTERHLAVNGEAEDEDVEATLDFLQWVVTSPEGTALLAEQFGPIPFENASEFENIFLTAENVAMETDRYYIPWVWSAVSGDNGWRAELADALRQYTQAESRWEAVESALTGR